MLLILVYHTETTSKMHMRYPKISFALEAVNYENELTQLHFTFHVEVCKSRSFHSGSKLNNTTLCNTLPL